MLLWHRAEQISEDPTLVNDCSIPWAQSLRHTATEWDEVKEVKEETQNHGFTLSLPEQCFLIVNYSDYLCYLLSWPSVQWALFVTDFFIQIRNPCWAAEELAQGSAMCYWSYSGVLITARNYQKPQERRAGKFCTGRKDQTQSAEVPNWREGKWKEIVVFSNCKN